MSKPRTTARCGLVTAPAIVGRALWIALVASSVGCAVSMRAPKIDSRAEAKVAVNVNQARLKMRSLVGPMCGEIERTADQIAAGTADPAVRRAAIRWKIEAVPTLSAALFQPEPFTAVLDTWVFFNQMADFFETGAGRKQLGDSAPVAVESCRRLEQEIADVFAAMTVSGDVSKVRAFAKSWAADHPIRYAIPDREMALSRALEREVPESWSTGEAVAEITTSIDDLNRKLDVYGDHLFRQVRWEAELLGSDLGLADVPPLAERAVQSVERAAAAFDRLAPGFERAVAVAEGTPALVASERKAAIEALSGDLTRTIAFLQQERIAALQQVTAERIAAISATEPGRVRGAKGARPGHRAHRPRAGGPRRVASRSARGRSPGLSWRRDRGDPRPRPEALLHAFESLTGRVLLYPVGGSSAPAHPRRRWTPTPWTTPTISYSRRTRRQRSGNVVRGKRFHRWKPEGARSSR